MASWKFVVHDEDPLYVFPYVTARCSECNSKLWMNPSEWMGTSDDGTQIFKAFITNYDKNRGRMFLLDTAKNNSDGKLPRFCCNCSKKMEGVVYD